MIYRHILVAISFLFVVVLSTQGAAANTSTRNNQYPIVLVHGLMGWGSDELCTRDGCFRYWGYTFVNKGDTENPSDIKNILKNYGYDTQAASVGPITKNWERAAELYAQLAGTTVDYGKHYSETVGITRFGKNYARNPLVADFCKLNTEGKINKIHVVGHSMGGQTVALLAHLLAHGDSQEQDATDPNDLSPLFTGGHNCLASVTTLSGTLNGSTALEIVTAMIPRVQQLFTLAGAITETTLTDKWDFDLNQWGIYKKPNELAEDYWQRVAESGFWNSPFTCIEDLSPAGAAEINAMTSIDTNAYYFSVATEKTEPNKKSSEAYEHPEATMSGVLMPTAELMGHYSGAKDGSSYYSRDWYKNDGLVNTISTWGPFNQPSKDFTPYDTIAETGVWMRWPLMESWDHGNIVGLNQDPEKLQTFYHTLADVLGSLSFSD